ncbi:MAG TPA: hypothetical protein VGL77_17870 [Armatimonadota bacterium]|jgi:hypothetical protein
MELLIFGLGRGLKGPSAAEATAKNADARSQRTAEHVELALARLEERLEKLSVLNMALWTLLKDKTGLTDEALLHEVANVQAARQESLDQAKTCPQCGRAMLARAKRCLYCDYHAPDADMFEQVSR